MKHKTFIEASPVQTSEQVLLRSLTEAQLDLFKASGNTEFLKPPKYRVQAQTGLAVSVVSAQHSSDFVLINQQGFEATLTVAVSGTRHGVPSTFIFAFGMPLPFASYYLEQSKVGQGENLHELVLTLFSQRADKN